MAAGLPVTPPHSFPIGSDWGGCAVVSLLKENEPLFEEITTLFYTAFEESKKTAPVEYTSEIEEYGLVLSMLSRALPIAEVDTNGHHFLSAAFFNGIPQGMIRYTLKKTTLEINSLATAPWNIPFLAQDSAQRISGIGTCLMNSAIEKTKALGMKRVSVFSMPHSIGFYKKFGMDLICPLTGFFEMNCEDFEE